RPSGVNGSELSHPVAPSNDWRRPSTGSAPSSPAKRWTIERMRPRLPGGTDDVAAPDARSVDPVSSDIALSFGADARVLDGRQDAVRARKAPMAERLHQRDEVVGEGGGVVPS